jgi:hypothetical protein
LQLHAINEEQNLAYRVLWTRQKEVEEQNKKVMNILLTRKLVSPMEIVRVDG